jgi:ABC-type nitrate/sulfonate/bicarbonate transport system substrate-binding protein
MCLAVMVCASQADGGETLRVGNASPRAFSFVPLDVGIDQGIFRKHGLEIEKAGLSGSAKLHQAMVAGAIDIGLGAGTDIAFIVKGVPEVAVAAMAGPPLQLGVVVPYDSPLKTADDLKGKKIGISTTGSLTQWLMLRLAKEKGWGRDGVTLVTVGADATIQAGLIATGQIDAVVSASALGYQLEETKKGRLLFPTSDIVSDFLIHAIFASQTLVRDNPDAVRRFLAGWFETIAFMRRDKVDTVRVARTLTGFSQAVEDREYDLVMPMFSTDGRFPPSAMAVVQSSFVELQLLDKEPDLKKYYTEEFLPGR